MLQSQSVPLAQNRKTGLHLLLVIGIVLYVYSPLLDHWMGHEYYARPHTHIHLPQNFFTEISTLYHVQIEDHQSENSEHEGHVLCLLDIKALFCIALDVNVTLIVQNVPLIFDLIPYFVQGSTVYPSTLDPPPRIDA